MTGSEKLDNAIREALGLPVGTDLRQIAYGRTEAWDSVAHMQLVAGIEDAFGIMLDTEEVISMNDYSAVRRILEEHHDLAIGA